MSILSFQNFRRVRAEPVDSGWSQSDLAEFYRAHKLLNDQGILVGLDQGMTDEHEPWLVFFDNETHDVFLHIARIDGSCILLCEHLSINLREKRINDLIQRFEFTVRNLLDNRAKQNSNVVTHPAARIITTVAAVFLLFKMENNRAHAESFFGAKGSNNIDNGHPFVTESRLLNIHRTSLSRIFETIDTPLHAAMMASFVVSNAIASQLTSRSEVEDVGYVSTLNNPEEANLNLSTKGVDFLVQPTRHEKISAYKQISNDKILDSGAFSLNLDSDVNELNYLNYGVLDSSKDVFDFGSIVSAIIENVELQQLISSTSDIETQIDNNDIDSIILALSEIQTSKKMDFLSYLSFYDLNESSVLHISVNLDNDIEVYSRDLDLEKIVDNEKYIGLDDTEKLVGELSIRELKAVSTLVEKYFETQLHRTDLGEMLRILMSQFDDFEIQIFEGNILVEQGDVGETPYSEVGLWTNTMADGSEISFIGSLNIIDDVTVYMT